MKSDALYAFDEIVARQRLQVDQVVLFGNSLGSGVATYVASQRKVAKLILNTPYDSLVNVAQGHYPVLPVRWLATQRFESIKLAPEIQTPVLCLVAEYDQVVPPEHAFKLCSHWKGTARIETIPGAGHNNILAYARTRQVIHDFVYQ